MDPLSQTPNLPNKSVTKFRIILGLSCSRMNPGILSFHESRAPRALLIFSHGPDLSTHHLLPVIDDTTSHPLRVPADNLAPTTSLSPLRTLSFVLARETVPLIIVPLHTLIHHVPSPLDIMLTFVGRVPDSSSYIIKTYPNTHS